MGRPPPPPRTCCATSGSSLAPSEPQFPICNMTVNSTPRILIATEAPPLKPSWFCAFFPWVAEETASKLVAGAALSRSKGGAGRLRRKLFNPVIFNLGGPSESPGSINSVEVPLPGDGDAWALGSKKTPRVILTFT